MVGGQNENAANLHITLHCSSHMHRCLRVGRGAQLEYEERSEVFDHFAAARDDGRVDADPHERWGRQRER
jgi:hypothetical protein